MRRASVVLLMTCAAVVVGCGGDQQTAATQPDQATPTPTATATRQAAEGDVRVVMKDFQFTPAAVTVDTGETITWVNEDSAQHNAVAADGAGPDSELFNQGETYSWTADKAGTIPYVCTIHPGMEGTITVR